MEFKKKDCEQLKNVLANIFEAIRHPQMVELEYSFVLNKFEEREKIVPAIEKMLEETRKIKRFSKVEEGKWTITNVEQTLTVDELVKIRFKFHTKETDKEPLALILGNGRYPDYVVSPEEIDDAFFNTNPYNITYNKFFASIFKSEFDCTEEES